MDRMTRIPSDEGAGTPKRRSSALTIAFVLGGLGIGVVLLCGCGVGLWVFWLASLNVTPEQRDQRVKDQAHQRWKQEEQEATSDQYRARAFLEYWLLLLEMNNLDEPYKLTTKAFQTRNSRQQFEEFVKTRPYLKERDHNWSHGVDGKPGDRFTFMLHSRGRNSFLWAEREAGEWRLDKIEDQQRE